MIITGILGANSPGLDKERCRADL